MRKVHLLIFLFFTLSSCSVPFHFNIYNLSENDIAITYTYVKETSHYGFNSIPKIQNFRKLTKLKKEKNQSIVKDSVSNTISCVLKKGQALWIGTISNFHLSSPHNKKLLYENLIDLRIKTSEREIQIHEKEVIDLFERIRNQHYGIKIN